MVGRVAFGNVSSFLHHTAADREGEGRIATAEDLVTEMRRLGAALAAVESTYSPTTGEEGGGGKGTGVGLGRGGEGGKEEEEGVGGGEGVGLVAALVGGGEGRWSAAAKRRWMGRLLRAVAPRGRFVMDGRIDGLRRG